VLMDCQMPEMDGFTATDIIRQREGDGRRTPIVAMTANAMAGDRELCLGAGMDDYLAKPVTVEALAAILARWLPAAVAAGDGTAAPTPSAGPALDPAVIAELRTLPGDEVSDLLTEIIDLFLAEMPGRLTALAAAVAAGDAAAVHRGAHLMAGSCASLGARDLEQRCRQLMALGAAGTLADTPALTTALFEAYDHLTPLLRAERTSPADHPDGSETDADSHDRYPSNAAD